MQNYSYHLLLASRSALKHAMILCSDFLHGEGLCLSSSVWLGNLNTLVLLDSDLSWLTFYYKNPDLKCSTNYFISEKVKFCIFSVISNKVNSTFNVLNIIDLKLNNKVIYLVKQRNFILLCVLLVLWIILCERKYIWEYSHSTNGKDIITLIFSYIY